MSSRILIQARAKAEIIDAFLWYEEQVIGLGENFMDEIESALQFIQSNPKLYSTSRDKYREAPLARFPYVIVYRLDQQKNRIVILSVFHFSRSPAKKPR